jgi:hypothetical protein
MISPGIEDNADPNTGISHELGRQAWNSESGLNLQGGFHSHQSAKRLGNGGVDK